MSALGQTGFIASLRTPKDHAAGLRAASGVDAQRRFDVHRNNSMSALVDALEASFPVTRALVGERFFRAMARERVRADPPRSPIMLEYGEGFDRFIAAFAPADGVPYLADMASLENARVQAWHAADAEPVEMQRYRELLAQPERLAATRLTLHPACRWLRSRHAMYSLWSAHQDLDDLAEADLSGIHIEQPESVLVTRPGWEVQVQLAPDPTVHWLDALQEGLDLGTTAQRCLGHAHPDLQGQLTALLSLLIQHGLAVALHNSEE